MTSSGFVSLITIKNKLNFLGKRRHSDSPRINTCNDLFRENKSLPYSVGAQKRPRAVPLKPEGVTHGDLAKGRFCSRRSGLEDPRSHSEEQGTRGFHKLGKNKTTIYLNSNPGRNDFLLH